MRDSLEKIVNVLIERIVVVGESDEAVGWVSITWRASKIKDSVSGSIGPTSENRTRLN